MCIEKIYQNTFVCSEIVNNKHIERKYYGFTKRQAQSMFIDEIKELSL